MSERETVAVTLSPPLGDGLKGVGCGGTDCAKLATHLVEVEGEQPDGAPTYYPTCLDCCGRMLTIAGVIA